ncbi:MAG: hypothetical protein ISN29_02550 [Gammaproteobacteria bacterium AqS3]|nr:hypothetical protein [Gammaproteobacteria bacterium AqS3]
MQHPHDPKFIQDPHNHHDHGMILSELKNIREDLKELMNVIRKDVDNKHGEINTTIKEFRNEIQNQRIKLTEITSNVEGAKKAIYMVAAPALFVAISAMAKAMNFI